MAASRSIELRRRDVLRLAGSAAAFAAAAGGWFPALAQGVKLNMATIGSGREGSALGSLFVKAGHKLMFSSRHPDQLKEMVAGLGPLAQAGTVAEAVAFADVVLLVVPYTAIESIAAQHGKALATKKLVLDVSNPIPRRDGEDFVKQINQQGGAGLATAKMLPGAHIVRGFNAIGSGKLAELAQREGDKKVGVPIAGDDQAAIALASSLIKEIGFEPVLVGGLAMGKYLVPGTPLAGEHSPAEIKQIASTLK